MQEYYDAECEEIKEEVEQYRASYNERLKASDTTGVNWGAIDSQNYLDVSAVQTTEITAQSKSDNVSESTPDSAESSASGTISQVSENSNSSISTEATEVMDVEESPKVDSRVEQLQIRQR